MKRIVSCFVVFVLLSLWPAILAAAEEAEARPINMMEELYVFPDKGAEFEALFKEACEAFKAHDFPYRVESYKLDDLRYIVIWFVEGTAGIDKLNTAFEVFAKKWGDEKVTAWIEKTYATMSHWKYSLWAPRPDLSYRPANASDDYKYIVWAQITIKLGSQQVVEEHLKRYITGVAEQKVPHAFLTAEGLIGVEVPVLSFVEWSSSPGSYWLRKDEETKNEKLMENTGAFWGPVMPHIRGFDWVAGRHLEEISYRPEKAAGTSGGE